ncbi:hypothetical protein BGZ95_000801 [Linnemannia exigua]|uniref:Late embryogenesis abundant protein LEA-2 subgroup domain-containing protein n=1 Tax=Linnemannia exigua TaxID=604196 RepID=A0AAD4D7S2_9FUNG|nr:hypothetical protein BGZ95_000801 [Linnemannia exigua]
MSNSYYQPSSPPTANRSTKPGYSPSASNAFVASNNNYIASPFDDDPVPQSAYNPSLSSHSTEKDPYSNPYNPDYMPKSYNNSSTGNNRGLGGDKYQGGSFHQSSLHSTQEHALSPSFTEKKLAGAEAAGAAGGQTYAMQHLHQNDSYNNSHPAGNTNNNSGGYPFGSNNPNAAASSTNYPNSNPHYYNGYDEDRPSLSNDTAPMRPYNDLENNPNAGLTRGKSGVSRLKYQKEKSKYLPCFPCIRSTCGRFTCCICLLLLLAIIALVIVVFTVFKLPKVEFKGLQGEPVFTYNQGQSTFAVNLTANIEVQNPNPLGFTFESITATAFYPNYAPTIGGGSLSNVRFPSHQTVTLHFPINASYDRTQDQGFTVISDILTRCGVRGGDKTNIAINYDLKLTMKIIGISISPTVKNQHVNIDCPADIATIATGLNGDLGGLIA